MRECERCGDPLRYGHVLNAIAGAADLDDDGPDDGLVVCRCGAVHTPVAHFLLGLVFFAGSAAGAFGSLWLLADTLDRVTADWSSYWQGAALLALFALPAFLMMVLVSLVWPLRFVKMRKPSHAHGKLTTQTLFEAGLILGFAALFLGFTDGFGPLSLFVLAVAATCFWASSRAGRRRPPPPPQ